MSTLSTLLSPVDYIWIKHPLKRAVDLKAPVISAFVGAVAVSAWPTFNLFGVSGFISGTDGLLQILTGFFITSLAAIATFSGATYRIDDPLDGEAATLHGDALTRRQFLCHLFAYLALASLLLYLAGVIGIAAASTLHDKAQWLVKIVARAVFVATYMALMGHVVGTTLIGLIFLSSRMSRVSGSKRFKVSPMPDWTPAPSPKAQVLPSEPRL